jgi:hypothetical protein
LLISKPFGGAESSWTVTLQGTSGSVVFQQPDNSTTESSPYVSISIGYCVDCFCAQLSTPFNINEVNSKTANKQINSIPLKVQSLNLRTMSPVKVSNSHTNEYWLSFLARIPADWKYGGETNGVLNEITNIFQIDSESQKSIFSLQILNGVTYQVEVCGSHINKEVCNQFKISDSSIVEQGIWSAFLININLSSDDTGFVRMWINNELVLTEIDIMTIYDSETSYLIKCGINQLNWKEGIKTNTETYAVDYQSFLMGYKNSCHQVCVGHRSDCEAICQSSIYDSLSAVADKNNINDYSVIIASALSAFFLTSLCIMTVLYCRYKYHSDAKSQSKLAGIIPMSELKTSAVSNLTISSDDISCSSNVTKDSVDSTASNASTVIVNSPNIAKVKRERDLALVKRDRESMNNVSKSRPARPTSRRKSPNNKYRSGGRPFSFASNTSMYSNMTISTDNTTIPPNDQIEPRYDSSPTIFDDNNTNSSSSEEIKIDILHAISCDEDEDFTGASYMFDDLSSITFNSRISYSNSYQSSSVWSGNNNQTYI